MKPWFRFKARLSFREWAQAERNGTLPEIHQWLRQVESALMARMT